MSYTLRPTGTSRSDCPQAMCQGALFCIYLFLCLKPLHRAGFILTLCRGELKYREITIHLVSAGIRIWVSWCFHYIALPPGNHGKRVGRTLRIPRDLSDYLSSTLVTFKLYIFNFSFNFYIYFLVLGIELKAWCMLSMGSTIELHPHSPNYNFLNEVSLQCNSHTI
jgi:hypothetical protein